MATTPNPASGVPVSPTRINNCLRSAGFWVNALPRYADRQQVKADFWAILSGILAAVTSLAIFPVLGESPTTEAEGGRLRLRPRRRHLRARAAGQELRRAGRSGT